MSNLSQLRRGRRAAIALVVAVIVVAAFVLRFQQLGQATPATSVPALRDRLGAPVEVAPAAARDLATWTTVAGVVKGAVQYAVVSNNALRVEEIPVREGELVAAGDVVLRLAEDAPSPMFHSVAQARAAYRNAQRDAERLRNLQAEGAVSRQELDHAETRLKVAAASLADAEGSTALRAGAAGVVTAIPTELGATVAAGKPLLWIARTDTVRIVFEVGSRQALELAAGQLAALTLPDGTRHTGTVGRLDLMADGTTHLLTGEAVFANPDGRLIPGLLVSIDVRTGHRPQALSLPRECLQRHDGGAAVWLVSGPAEAPTATLRPITVGLETTDRIEVTAGLEPGEVAVRFGQTALREGAPVRVLVTGKEG